MPYLKKLPPLEPCPFEAALAVVGGKWKARILRCLADGPRTFGELKRELIGITQQVLSAALKALEADGMLRREGARPHGSTFALSADGRSLLEALDPLALWGAARLRRQGLQWAENQGPLSLRRLPELGKDQATLVDASSQFSGVRRRRVSSRTHCDFTTRG